MRMRLCTPISELPAIEKIPYGSEDLVLPKRYQVIASGRELPYEVLLDVLVANDGEPTCDRLECSKIEGGVPVTSEGIRKLPIARLLRLSVDVASMVQLKAPDGRVGFALSGSADASALMQAEIDVKRRKLTWRLTDEHLKEVAAIYRANFAKSGPRGVPQPGVAVAKHFRQPRSTAARWIALARDRGFLEPFDQRKE